MDGLISGMKFRWVSRLGTCEKFFFFCFAWRDFFGVSLQPEPTVLICFYLNCKCKQSSRVYLNDVSLNNQIMIFNLLPIRKRNIKIKQKYSRQITRIQFRIKTLLFIQPYLLMPNPKKISITEKRSNIKHGAGYKQIERCPSLGE